MNLILLGHSCSGKTTLQNEICSKNAFQKVRLVTDRAKRDDTEDDYIFVTPEEYDRWLEDGHLLFSNTYENADGKILRYGLPKSILKYPKVNKCLVLGPDAFEQLLRSDIPMEFTPMYIHSHLSELLHRSGQRDHISGRNEFIRRYNEDGVKFKKLLRNGDIYTIIENNWELDKLYLNFLNSWKSYEHWRSYE